MYINSTQGSSRLSLFFALSSLIGCGLLSIYCFYKESEYAKTLAKLSEEIKEMEVRCSASKNVIPRSSACAQLIEQRIKFHRNQITRQAYRDKAGAYFFLSCAIPLLILAIARWWYWILTGRFRSRKRQRK